MKWKKAEKKDENTFKIPERWVWLHYYEAFNLLFRIENALRVFVYIVLKNEFKDKWVDVQVMSEDANEGTIGSIARKRMSQSKSFGYLGESVSCPIMHLTSGELTRLITDTQWKHFKDHFSGSRDIMRNKLDEIAAIRNSLAHFRPIKVEDLEVLSQNSRHVLVGIEDLFAQVLQQNDIVPTNTESRWYRELRTLGTEEVKLSFHQSIDEKWLRILLTYDCPVANYVDKGWGMEYYVLSLSSSAIISLYQAIRDNIIHLYQTSTIWHYLRKTSP